MKYPKLDRDPEHAREARFLLKIITDLMNGKRLRDESLGRALRHFIKFGNKWLYYEKLEVRGYGECCLSDMIDTPLFSNMLNLPSDKQHRTALDELRRMLHLLGQICDPYPAKVLFDSRYPTPRKEYDPDEEVWRRMADEDFSGDPWAADLDDIDYDYIDSLSALDALDDSSDDDDYFQLQVVLMECGAGPGLMSYDELKARVREHLKARLKAIGERIAFLLLSSS